MRVIKYVICVWLALCSVALADPIWGRGGAGLAEDTALSTTSPLGGGGDLSAGLTLTCTTCVTAASTFGVDNVLVRSDGTGRGTQATGLIVDDSNLLGLGLTPTHALTLPAASTGIAIYNAAGTERAVASWAANVFTFGPEANGGTSRSLALRTDSYTMTLAGTAAANSLLLTGSSSSQFAFVTGSSNVGLKMVGNVTTGAAPVLHATINSSFSSTSLQQPILRVDGTVNQTSGTGGVDAIDISPTLTAVGSGGANMIRVRPGGTDRWRVDSLGAVDVDSTVTTAGTTGNVTINKPCGTANIAAAGTAVTVTNSLVTANTIMSVLPRTNDSTCRLANYVPGSGTVTFNMTAACNAETSIGFCIADRN